MAYDAVVIASALHSAMGLPRRSSSAAWMLEFVMPADASSMRMMCSFFGAPGSGVSLLSKDAGTDRA